MKPSSPFRAIALASLAAGLFAAAPSNAAVTYAYDILPSVDVPGISTFNTHGSMMAGMSVTATFSTGFTQTLPWAVTGADSGGVTGTGWSLGLTGDSYSENWYFKFLTLTGAAPLTLTRLVFDGAPGFTVFDLTLDGEWGTVNSAQGRDFEFFASDVTATYSKPVGVAGGTPYDYDYSEGLGPDLWQVLTVDFGNGIKENFSFRQDTDNRIPEPASLALLGAGLLGLGFSRRRKF